MSRKFKLFFSLASLCLSVAMLCFGVYSAMSVSYSVTGSVSYEVNDVFVDIETTLYMSNEDFSDAKNNVQNNINNLEQSLKNNQTPSNLIKTSYEDFHSTYNNGQVDTRDEISFDNTGNELSIKYGSFVDNQSAYSYFIVIKITNYAQNAIGAVITPHIENLNSIVSQNSLTKNISGATESSASEYFILSMTLDDATLSTNGEFTLDVNITKETQKETSLVLNSVQGEEIESLDGINYSTKTLQISQSTYFMPYGQNLIVAYNMEFKNLPQNITALDFSCKFVDETYYQQTLPIFVMVEGNYSDLTSLIVACQPLLEKNGDSLLGLSMDFTLLGTSLSQTEDITPYYERNYGMYVGEHEDSLKFCLVGYYSSLGNISSAPEINFSISFVDELDKDIYYLRDDGTYAWGYNVLLRSSSKYAQENELSSEIVVPKEYMGKKVSMVFFTMSGFFFDNKNIESIVFESDDTIIESGGIMGSFSCLKELKQVALPKHLKEIPDDCFAECSSLTEITIPEEVEIIGGEAFLGCPLETITIPSSVQSIMGAVFRNCPHLNQVYIDSLTIASDQEIIKQSGLLENLQSSTGKVYVLAANADSVCEYITQNFTKGSTIVYDGKSYVEFTKK